MSHGIWTTEELVTINKGKDNNLITEFMNESTFLEHEIKAYPYHMRHEYLCEWVLEDDIEELPIYATDPEALKVYIEANYNRLPDTVTEIITTHKPIVLA